MTPGVYDDSSITMSAVTAEKKELVSFFTEEHYEGAQELNPGGAN